MVQHLLVKVDEIMYLAKKKGKNCIETGELLSWMTFTDAMKSYSMNRESAILENRII
jgi:hypothetical protein